MREKLSRFMMGRYGVDDFSRFMLYAAIALMLVGIFLRGGVCEIISMALLIWGYFRMFSKNVQKRYEENERYLKLKNRFTGFFTVRKNHRIYKCPDCKQKIRVPKGKGKIEITCPKCRTRFVRKS